jgi:hypothetical protein
MGRITGHGSASGAQENQKRGLGTRRTAHDQLKAQWRCRHTRMHHTKSRSGMCWLVRLVQKR